MKTQRTYLSRRLLVPLALAAALTGCSADRGVTGVPERAFTILAVNDIYRIEGTDGGAEGGLSRLRHLRARLESEGKELLVLHGGDMLFPSLPSRLYKGEQMIDVLNLLDGDGAAFDHRMFATFGNHEFDDDKLEEAAMLDSRVEESQFRWLDSNLEWATGAGGTPVIDGQNLSRLALLDVGGVRVGLFSLTTDFKDPAYVTRFADHADVASEMTARLREQGAEVVVALTHLFLAEDRAFLTAVGDDGPDLVIGGHEHVRLNEQVGGRWILKADAEARSATQVRVVPRPGGLPEVSFTYHELDAEAPTDPTVDVRVGEWLGRFDREYCASIKMALGCLEQVVGRTRVELVAEELEIRRFETNYGSWIADRAREGFADHGAQVAFVNSGSLRLNQDVSPGAIHLEHVEETFQYSSELVLLKIPGAVLRQIVDHAVTRWTGNGKWLQVSGFAFHHDPGTQTASHLTLLTRDGPRPVSADEEILAVTLDFLADPGTGQDGYTMITRDMHVPVGESASLRQLVIDALGEAMEEGIAPEVEGRICNPQRPGPCLAQ